MDSLMGNFISIAKCNFLILMWRSCLEFDRQKKDQKEIFPNIWEEVKDLKTQTFVISFEFLIMRIETSYTNMQYNFFKKTI